LKKAKAVATSFAVAFVETMALDKKLLPSLKLWLLKKNMAVENGG